MRGAGVGVALVGLYEDVANVVRGNVNGVCDTCHAKHALLEKKSYYFGSGHAVMVRREGSCLGGRGEHALAGVESGAAGVLNFFDLAAALADDGAHARVGDHELDGDSATAWHGGLVVWLIVDSSHDQSERLVAPSQTVAPKQKYKRRCTLDTASKGPLTLRIRSGLPGMLSDTMTFAPLFSLISFTCAPALPIIIDAS